VSWGEPAPPNHDAARAQLIYDILEECHVTQPPVDSQTTGSLTANTRAEICFINEKQMRTRCMRTSTAYLQGECAYRRAEYTEEEEEEIQRGRVRVLNTTPAM